MKLSRLIVFLFTALLTITSWGVLPPQYLSVHQWKRCVSEEARGAAQFICLPLKRPPACPRSSWKQLTVRKLIDQCYINKLK